MSEPIETVLSKLSRRGVAFWLDGQRLRYRGPAGLSADEAMDEVRSRRGEVVDFLRKVQNVRTIPPLVAAPETREAPVTTAQETWWRLSQIPGAYDYFPTWGLRFEGPLDVPQLIESVREIVRRHSILRSRFVARDGTPVQVIGEPQDVEIDVLDLSHLDREAAERVVSETLSADRRRGFDLAVEPPFRARIVVLDADNHLFWTVAHHIAIDIASRRILTAELRAHYAARAGLAVAEIPEPPVQYADYARWERQWLGGADEPAHHFWAHRLKDAIPLNVPATGERNVKDVYDEAVVDFELEGDAYAEVRSLARLEGTTVPMVLIAAYLAALSWWTKQPEVLIGYWHRGRVPGTERLIGLFSRMRPIQVTLDEAMSTSMLLAIVRHAYAEAHDLRHTVTPELVRGTRLARVMVNIDKAPLVVPGRMPPFSDNVRFCDYRGPDDAVSPVTYDLMLNLSENPISIKGRASYAGALFERESIAALVACFRHVLTAAASDPARPVRSLIATH